MRGLIEHLKGRIRNLKEYLWGKKEQQSTLKEHRTVTLPKQQVDEQEALIVMLLAGWNVTDSGLYYPRT
jgi:hypothetical protein